MSIELKTTGMLMDEHIRTEILIDNLGKDPILLERIHIIDLALTRRLSKIKSRELVNLYFELRTLNNLIYSTKRRLNNYGYLDTEEEYDIGPFARCAWLALDLLEYSEERLNLIVKIDSILGESQYSPYEI